MDTVRRKSSSHPNRQGGRGNRGGRSRGRGGGRGRGRGQPPAARGGGGGPGPSPRGGGGARKAGDICDEDFSLADQDDDYDYDDDDFDYTKVPKPTAAVGHPTRSRGRGTLAFASDRPSASASSARPSASASSARPSSASSSAAASAPAPGRRVQQQRTKVPMQKIHMTSDNQEMVRDMLKQLNGGEDLNLGETEYETLNWRASDHYWMDDNKLQIQEHKHNEDEDENNKVYSEFISQNALKKLQKYGFDRTRCKDALDVNEGDIGKSLEYLAGKCFNVPDPDSNSNPEITLDEIQEEREQEQMVLESMYTGFVEKVKDHVWTVSIDIPVLNKWCSERLDHKSKAQQQMEQSKQKKEVCRFFHRGTCKFSSAQCRYSHDNPDEIKRKQLEEDNKIKKAKQALVSEMYTLEVRFPKGNKYPFDCPYVLFSCENALVPGSVCLNIAERLTVEAKSHAAMHTASIFALLSILQDEEEIKTILQKPEHMHTNPELIISRKQMLERARNPNRDYSEENAENPKASSAADNDDEEDVKVERPTKKDFAARKMDPNEVKRINRTLKDKFRRKQDSAGYKKMVTHRRTLPAWSKQAEILQKLRDNQVLVVSGMTGCGKSTQVPQFILDSHLVSKGADCCNIVCTQPRRISAMAVAERVSAERCEAVGGSVGYQIRLESVMSSRTRLLFCTTGILLRRLEGDAKLEGVTYIIVDEVHERSEESDFLMMILRDILPDRPDLRVILMSATLNADLFSSYFYDCAVIDIPGKTFEVEQYFMEDAIEMTGYVMDDRSPYAKKLKDRNAVREEKGAPRGRGGRNAPMEDIEMALADINIQTVDPPKDNILDENLAPKQLYRRYSGYMKSTVKCMAMTDYEKINYELIETIIEFIVEGDHEFPEEGAILVFLPGMAEITSMYDNLRGNKMLKSMKTRIIPLHSTLSSEDQKMVFDKPPEGVRKIVLATNIAETSITIDDVVFVIDAGRMKEKRYDQSKGMESLETVWVSRANALQRRGRAGRVCKGVCFHLFTGHRYDFHLRDQPIPEIQRAPLEQIILKIKMLDIFFGMHPKNVLSRLIEGPALASIENAMKRLTDLGALDEEEQLTALGTHLAAMPVDVRIGKLMLFGAIFRCLDPALTIAACLSFKSPFVAPFGKRDEADERKQTFATGNSDHLTMWKAYKAWMDAEDRSNHAGYQFCQLNYLSIKTLQMIASMKRQFVELLSDIGFVQEGLTGRDIERMARRKNGDGVSTATGMEANVNSANMKLVAAILVAALYPNIVKISVPEGKFQHSVAGSVPTLPKAQEMKFCTRDDGYINIHPSSINFQVRYYESPYLVYHEKVKTAKVYVRDCSMVSVYPLLLFGGGSISVDLCNGQFVLSVDDGWIRFISPEHEVAELLRELRQELNQLLQDKIEMPSLDLCNCPRGNKIIKTIVTLISTQ